MEGQSIYERVLIAAALILCAVIIGYNAFYTPPELDAPTVIYIDPSSAGEEAGNSNRPPEDEGGGEEYEPQPLPLSAKVHINTADAGELDTLPGVGPALAQRILDYRASHGGFRQVEQLMEIDGIGEKTFEKLEPYVTLDEK